MSAKACRHLRNALIVVLVLATLYVAYRYTLHCLVEAKLDEIRKQGYPVTLAELDKWYPQPPPGENAAEIYEDAFTRYARWDYEHIRVLPLVGDATLPKRGVPLSGDVRDAIASYMADNRSAVKLLHDGVARKRCRYPVSYSAGFDTPVPHVNGVRQGARLLGLEAVWRSDKGDGEAVADSVAATAALARSLEDEPDGISQLVRIAVLQMAASRLEDALNCTPFTDTQLRDLYTVFANREITNSLTRAFVGEIANNTSFFSVPVDRQLGVMLPPPPEPHTFQTIIGVIPNTWYRRPQFYLLRASGLLEIDLFHYCGIMEKYLAALRLPLPERLTVARSIDKDFSKLPRFCIMSRWLTCGGSGMSAYIVKDFSVTATLRCCCASLAVERYRLANGALPDSLGDLVPKFLDAVPIDPFDGQPLRYRKLTKGYVVYSVGEDGKDDGGDEKKDITFTVER